MLWAWLAGINKRLWLALAISVLLHFLIVAGSEDWLPGWLPDDDLIEVTLAASPPPIIKPTPQHVVAEPVHKQVRAEKPAPQPAPHLPDNNEQVAQAVPQPDDTPPAQTAPETAQSTIPVQAATQPESPVPAEKQPEPPAEPVAAPEPPPPAMPKHVEIEFLVDYDGASAVERQNYQAFDDGHYVLSSTVEAKGLLSLALSDLNQKSTGHVTPQGLRPDTFIYQYGKNSKKAQKASFDWVGKTLAMEVDDSKQSVALEDGTQDLLSFLYQFMFTPPLDQFQLAITTGKQLKTYHYLFEGEEEIKTKLGTLHALHISKSSGKGDEKTEIWLAEDYHYLPVKIRKTNSAGKVIQNTINAIKITP
jgi:hypothetical protein